MSSTQKPADVTAERRSHWWWTVPGCLAMVLLNAAVSYGIVRLNAPVTVAFNMKQTVDAFFDSASQKQLSEAQSKALSARFNTALEASLYKYPLTYWLNIITSLGCLEGGDLDIAYLSEIDPTWTDSSLTTILNPEAVIFANPIAQGACAADAIASAFNMPLDVLFWCAGSQGSMYPFNGWVSNESSPLQSSLLVSERMAFKLHRQGMIMETIGKNNAVCNEYPSPILPKERWRYQMVNMYPDSGQCHPFGRSVTRWETGKNPPNTKKNFGYLMWRKRNCVFTSNRFIDFLIRLLITAIVISPVIIWSWDTVKETTADGMLAAAFVILYSGVLLFILYFCFSALTDLQKPDERKSDERNEDE